MRSRLAEAPISLRVSVTDRCDLKCSYCVPASTAPKAAHEDVLSFEQILLFVSMLQRRFNLARVRLTGGEPLLRPGIENLVAGLAAAGVPDLALTTSGQQLADKATGLKEAGLDRVNISLDTLDPETFAAITGGASLSRTLAGIVAARQAGLAPVKLNAVVLRGRNDHEIPALIQFAIESGCQVRFLELMPIGEAAAGFEERFVPAAEIRSRINGHFSLTALAVDPLSTSRNFESRDSSGGSTRVGFISPYSEPFCGGCWRLRLTSTGTLIGCLARPEGLPLAPLLRNGAEPDCEALAEAVEQALRWKRRNREFAQPRQMVQIGG